jgi:hypothetical protein
MRTGGVQYWHRIMCSGGFWHQPRWTVGLCCHKIIAFIEVLNLIIKLYTFYYNSGILWPVKFTGLKLPLLYTSKVYCSITFANRIEIKPLIQFIYKVTENTFTVTEVRFLPKASTQNKVCLQTPAKSTLCQSPPQAPPALFTFLANRVDTVRILFHFFASRKRHSLTVKCDGRWLSKMSWYCAHLTKRECLTRTQLISRAYGQSVCLLKTQRN